MQTKRIFSSIVLIVLAMAYQLSAAQLAEAITRRLAATPGDQAILQELKASIGQITDVDARMRYMVIYALGCLYTGDNQEAGTVMHFIQSRHATHPMAQYIGIDYIGAPCTQCKGAGHLVADCAACNKSGTCRHCNGEGNRQQEAIGGVTDRREKIGNQWVTVSRGDAPTHRTVPCGPCRRSGKCSTCNGEGTVKTNCQSCHGQGKIFNREIAEGTYRALLHGAQPQLPEWEKDAE